MVVSFRQKTNLIKTDPPTIMNLLELCRENKLVLTALYKIVLECASEIGLQLEGSISKICSSADVNRCQLYEKKKHIENALTTVELAGPGRPALENEIISDDRGRELQVKVLRFRLDHPGAVVVHKSGGHSTYSNSFRRFILDLADEWEESPDIFWVHAEVPLPTLRSWQQVDRRQPFKTMEPRAIPAASEDASDVCRTILEDYAVWDGRIKDFLRFEVNRFNLPFSQVHRVLVICGMLNMKKKKSPRYRGSTEKLTPGTILVTDGKNLEVISTVTGEVSIYNWQGIVDQTTTCHTATVITDTECAAGVYQAFTESCQLLGREPAVLLHDNKPIHSDGKLQATVEQTTSMVAATLNRPENKASIEGEFGKFAQQVGPILLNDSSYESLKKSAASEVIRAYSAGVNHAGRFEFDGKSRIQVLREACPDPEKDREFIEQLRAKHNGKYPKEILPTQTIARKLLDHGFSCFNLDHLDSKEELRVWLSGRYTPAAVRQAFAIFGTEREKGRLRNETAHRYLVKLIQNCQEEIDLRKQELYLLDFAEQERQAWLVQFEQEYFQIAAQSPKEQINRACECSIFGSLLLQRSFWEKKLKTILKKQSNLFRFAINHVRRLFEAQWADRFQLIGKIIEWEKEIIFS